MIKINTQLHIDKKCSYCGTKFNCGSYPRKRFCSNKCRMEFVEKYQRNPRKGSAASKIVKVAEPFKPKIVIDIKISKAYTSPMRHLTEDTVYKTPSDLSQKLSSLFLFLTSFFLTRLLFLSQVSLYVYLDNFNFFNSKSQICSTAISGGLI